MRIAVVAPPVTPLAEAQLGGAQAFVADLARALQVRGHQVTVYCSEGSALPGLSLRTVPVADTVAGALVMPGAQAAKGPIPELRDAFQRMFELVVADGADAVSQHPPLQAAGALLVQRQPTENVLGRCTPAQRQAQVAQELHLSSSVLVAEHVQATSNVGRGMHADRDRFALLAAP